MNVAAMQPYLFPYLGYFQLICHAEVFVIYDDANYIKQGYINRNNILVNGEAYRFTVPVINGSSYTPIYQVTFSNDVEKLIKTIEQAYKRAPFFNEVYPIIEKSLRASDRAVPSVCHQAMILVLEYLELPFMIKLSSKLDYDRSGSASDKLIALCHTLHATQYTNSVGGQELYDKGYFQQRGIQLSFIKMRPIVYPQGKNQFIPNLSIIDALMWCPKPVIRSMMNQYDLD